VCSALRRSCIMRERQAATLRSGWWTRRSVSVATPCPRSSAVATLSAPPLTHCIAGDIHQEAVVDDFLVSWIDSRIGLYLHGGSTSVPGGYISSTQSNVDGNELGLLVEQFGAGMFYRDAIKNNEQIAHVQDHGDIHIEDSGITGNSGIKLYAGTHCPYYAGYWAEGDSTSTFHNVLWHSNCTESITREAMLELHDNASALLQNNTMADNQEYTYIQTVDNASLTVRDSILADSGPATTGTYPSDDGIICGSTGTHTLDEIGDWQLQTAYTSCPTPGTLYNADPLFKSSSMCTGTFTRQYYLDNATPSPFKDKSTLRLASDPSVDLAGHTTKIPTSCSSWPTDTGKVDLGFHWWPVP
jgi:hypothetical protein